MKRYNQRCSLARALDVVGERWSLLIVRELGLGPRRYRDLQDGLPGVPTNLLASRLKDLTEAGVIIKRALPPPTAVTVYELTEAGWALRPVLYELRQWGDRYGAAPSDSDSVRPWWVLLSAVGRPTTVPDGHGCELRVADEVFQLSASDSRLLVRGGPGAADASITIAAKTLYRLTAGQITAAAALRDSTVAGERTIARQALESLRGVIGA